MVKLNVDPTAARPLFDETDFTENLASAISAAIVIMLSDAGVVSIQSDAVIENMRFIVTHLTIIELQRFRKEE